MANYSTSGHYLKFNNDYDILEVRNNSDVLQESFPLDATSTSVSVVISGSNYSVNSVADFGTPTHKLDVNGGTVVTFSAGKMGGTGIMDLRDMGMVDDYSIEYDLACGAIKLRYVAGSFDLHVWMANTDCCAFQLNRA